jgi:beta-galactosidase
MADESVELDNGWTADVWLENVDAHDAEVLARVATGERAGVPAYTRRTVGAGSAAYLATRPDEEGLDAVVGDLVDIAGVQPVAVVDAGLEVTRRTADDRSYLFLINQTDLERRAEASGRDLVSGESHEGSVRVAPGAVVVIEESR